MTCTFARERETWGRSPERAPLIAERLAKVGIQLDLVVTEGSVIWADSEGGGIEQTGNFDLNLWDDGYAGTDPSDFLWELYHSTAAQPDSGWNIVRWNNPGFDALLEQSRHPGRSHPAGLFCRMAQILEEQVPVILLFSTVNADTYSTRLQGIQSSVNDLVTWNVADWSLAK